MPVSEIRLTEGFSELSWDLTHVSAFSLKTMPGTSHDVLIRLLGAGSAEFDVEITPDSKLSLFYLNEGQEMTLNETYHIQKNGRLDLAYADFNEETLERNTDILLSESGAEVDLKSAILVKSRKELKYRFTHQAPYTKGDMENFAVTMGEGSMNLYAIGRIEKSAPNSETHQTSRVLNFNSTNRACVYPQLFIDNNEVKASHAESSGQVDPDQLYYLQSRGLSQSDAVRLIIQGYLTSILVNITDETLKDKLMHSIERKVEEVCSM